MTLEFLPSVATEAVISEKIEELVRLVERFTSSEGFNETKIAGLRFYRSSTTTKPDHYIYEATACFAVQGRKHIIFGNKTYNFEPSAYLVTTVDLPIIGQILEATPEKPYLVILLSLKPEELSSLIIEAEICHTQQNIDDSQIHPNYITPILADALIRLVKLLDVPQEIPIMAPLIQREIYFRLLQSGKLESLLQIAVGNGKLKRVALAIDWIKQNLTTPLKIEELAKQVNMSVSGLHHHFKEVTLLSPLQFQKMLRLQRARNLLMTDNTHVDQVAYQVGYESSSQFSREYSRLFGQSPLRDANQFRAALMNQDVKK